MVHRCCISSCGMNVRVVEAKGLSYHGFPNKEPLREQWIQAILPHLDKPEAFKVVPKYTRVCSRHFRKKDYSVDIKKRARLNSNAVPSVFPRKNSPIVVPIIPNVRKDSVPAEEESGGGIKIENVNAELILTPSSSSSLTENVQDLMAQIVGFGLDDHKGQPINLEIEILADHFNNSLLTEFNNSPITLSLGLEELHLPSGDQGETPSTASSSSEDIHNLFLVEDLKLPDQFSFSPAVSSTLMKSPANSRKKKAPEEVRLLGVTKKHKKDKISGRFSVERFSNSDKDIEYYTGFTTYKNFEAFFISLEVYVERLRVTDVMFGVANLDKLPSESGECSSSLESLVDPLNDLEIMPPPPPPLEESSQKRRPFHGRSMARIDELFMTIIRLRRKLPEKVLGHMFCISQPTVSRIIRAWTVLLSKLVEGYTTTESLGGEKVQKSKLLKSDHVYTTSKGQQQPGQIPESFRLLFHSELAKSIVVSSVSAKDKKTNQKWNNADGTTAKRPKKTHGRVMEEEEGRRTEENEHINDSEIRDLLDPLLCGLVNVEEESDFLQSFLE